MISFILGIITGILLTVVAFFSGRKINDKVDTYEKEKYTTEHPRQMAQIIRMEDKIKKILEE